MRLLSNSLCLLACLLCSHVAVAAKVRLLVESYPPYMAEDADNKGVVTGLVVEAFKRVGTKTEVQFKSWLEVERKVDNDKALSFMWSKTKSRAKKWYFSEPIYQQKKRLLANGGFHQSVDLIHQLRNIDIGVTRGFTYGRQFEGFRHKLKISENNSDYLTVQRLINSQVELAVVDPAVAVYLVDQFFSNKTRPSLKFIDVSYFDSTDYYLVCSKTYGNCLNHIKKFNKGLDILSQEGTRGSLFNQAETLKQ
jgi:polar amino acid transport system substrate-binding protein